MSRLSYIPGECNVGSAASSDEAALPVARGDLHHTPKQESLYLVADRLVNDINERLALPGNA